MHRRPGTASGSSRTPATFVEIARVGPIARQGGRIAETIADRAFTAVVAVSLPEEMAVAETIALERALADQGLELELVALNARYPDRFGGRHWTTLRGARGGEHPDEPLGAGCRCVRALPCTGPGAA